MTDDLVKTDPAAWELALAEFKAAKAAFDLITHTTPEADYDVIHERYCEAEFALLEQWAPSLDAVITKLMIIFEDEMHSELPESLQKLKIIGDIRRFTYMYE